MLTRNSQYYRTKNHYSYEEKMGMIQEYLTTEISMTQMVKKYHIGWSTIPKWMRNFGIPMPNEAPVQITMSEENKKQEKKDTFETLEAKLQELQAELDKEKLCALFGKTRQAYYQRLNYNYQEYAEDGIILDLIAEYREDMGRLGGRKLLQDSRKT